jgi:hypothetical protein
MLGTLFGTSRMMFDEVDEERRELSTTQTKLDGMVVDIELTMISIIQGIALSFLIDNAGPVLLSSQFTRWPYVATGLLIILLFWSRSLVHTLTLIRWPLEFGHNFMYIACTLVEAIIFTQLTSVPQWYALSALFAFMIWALVCV